ncbi:MAG: hypothetical protein C5B52_07920 [Bacteroidetes bacterium]|nr:MAG: hypothetical protein C5B52_07920 [Bacteroidota bacterium]
MKYIGQYLSEYFKQESARYILFIAAILSVLIYFNYQYHLDSQYAKHLSNLSRFIYYFILFLGIYVISFISQKFFHKKQAPLSQKAIAFILITPALFAFRISFALHEPLIRLFSDAQYLNYNLLIFGWVIRALVVMIPIYFYWIKFDRGRQPLYGTTRSQSLKPYFLLLGFIIPILLLSFRDPHMFNYYPRVKILFNVPGASFLRYLIFECCYGFDFLSIEFFFRGFLILALARELGPRLIIPMAAFYCTIHFGKPLPECISSFFGGIFLGAISYRTKSIWGGLVMHLGIAWFMELAGIFLR